jgi:bacteriocin-like protein
MNTERELTIDELAAISGGRFEACLGVGGTLQGKYKGGDPTPATDAWNKLLRNYGY